MRRLADDEVVVDPDAELAQPLISSTRPTGSTTTPLPMTHILFLRRMPEGTKCRTYFCLPMKTVWPALLPPWRADDDVRVLRQHVNDFAFAFVAPLGAD